MWWPVSPGRASATCCWAWSTSTTRRSSTETSNQATYSGSPYPSVNCKKKNPLWIWFKCAGPTLGRWRLPTWVWATSLTGRTPSSPPLQVCFLIEQLAINPRDSRSSNGPLVFLLWVFLGHNIQKFQIPGVESEFCVRIFKNHLCRNPSLHCSRVIGEFRNCLSVFHLLLLKWKVNHSPPPPVSAARRATLLWEGGWHLVTWSHPLLSCLWKVLSISYFLIGTWLIIGVWYFVPHTSNGNIIVRTDLAGILLKCLKIYNGSCRIPFEDENILSLYNKIRTQTLKVFTSFM